MAQQLKVFLCHASFDKPAVRDIYKRLVADGIETWLDEEKLLPGQDWELEITRAVLQSHVIIICLSCKSITKTGFVQKEIKKALDLADYQPEGTIFLIPARLEDCEVPERLRRWQWVNLFLDGGYQRLLLALHLRESMLQIPNNKLEWKIEEVYQSPSPIITNKSLSLTESQPSTLKPVLQIPSFLKSPLPTQLDDDKTIHMITIVLRSTGDRTRDVLRIRRIYGLINSYPGNDRFGFHVYESGRGYLLEFPNGTTEACPKLLQSLALLVGPDNVRVEPISFF